MSDRERQIDPGLRERAITAAAAELHHRMGGPYIWVTRKIIDAFERELGREPDTTKASKKAPKGSKDLEVASGAAVPSEITDEQQVEWARERTAHLRIRVVGEATDEAVENWLWRTVGRIPHDDNLKVMGVVVAEIEDETVWKPDLKAAGAQPTEEREDG